MKVELLPIDSIKPYPKNPRRHKSTIVKIAKSLEAFGWRQPIVVDPRTKHIIVGEGRWHAAQHNRGKSKAAEAKKLWSTVPVHFATDLSAKLIRAYRLADNRIGGDSTDDEDTLIEELAAIQRSGVPMESTGYEDAELAAFLNAGDPSTADDEPPAEYDIEIPEEPDSKRGEVYNLGPHRLMCGDLGDVEAIKKLMGAERAEVVFTDAPYAIYGSSTGLQKDVTDDRMVRPFFRNIIVAMHHVLKPFGHFYLCADWRSYATWWEVCRGSSCTVKNMIVWDKGEAGQGAMYRNTHEVVVFGTLTPVRKRMSQKIVGQRTVMDSNIWKFPRVKVTSKPGTKGKPGDEARLHNAQKPVALVARALANSSNEGAIVVDFCGGSGTTMIAAEENGRRCRMMEDDPGWCDVIRLRYARAVQDPKFAPRGEL